jgi:AcrR family transcriptional regulator
MTTDLNSVKSSSDAGTGKAYHHGHLRAALIEAAEAILNERGPTGFSLREAARRAGVSPAAPAHHFGDTRGLLTAVAARGFERLTDQLATASEKPSSEERLQAVGAAYLQFALANRALFEIMWMRDLIDPSDSGYLAAGRSAFNILERAATGREIPVATEPRLPAAHVIAAWAMVHGLAKLTLDGALDQAPPQLREEVIRLMPVANNAA